MSSTSAQTNRPLRVLSLDGGGIRGLSALLILRRLMHTIRRENDLHELPKPCQFFDLIGGTSTGGIIAIMLGRLEMDVQSCIEAYCELSKDVFQDEHLFGKIGRLSGRLMKASTGKPWFDAAKLETAVKAVVQNRLGDPNAPLIPTTTSAQGAKVFVVATREGSTSEALFRTYQSAEESYNLTIWEACRATSAAPLFFKAVEVGTSPPVSFVDGGLGKNNPVNLVVREARSLWPTRSFAVVVSLGTGKPYMKAVGKKATEVLGTCIRLATDAENTAREFREQQPHMVKMHKYFRFNVEQGLQDVGLEEWKSLGSVVEPATMKYLDEVQADLEILAGILKNPENIFLNNGSLHEPIYSVPLTSSPVFVGRTEILKTMENFLLGPEPSGKLKILALHGLGGVGKTQIAVKFAELFRPRYKYVFWIDSKTRQSVEESFVKVASLLTPRQSRSETKIVSSMFHIYDRLRESKGQWLLLFDNADFLDNFDLNRYFPKGTHDAITQGNIIITSRDPSSAILTAGGLAIEVGELPQDDAIDLLLLCACKPLNGTERAPAAEIVEELGNLALAIVQAGCLITKRNKTLSNYLREYRELGEEVLDFRPAKSLMAGNDTVFRTWEISYEYVQKKSQLAARLLNFFAFFDNTEISLDVMGKGCQMQQRWGPGGSLIEIQLLDSTVPQWLIGIFYPEGKFTDSHYDAEVQELRSLSLVQQNSVTRSLYIHPLVHEWSRLRLSKAHQSQALYDAIGFLSHATPVADVAEAIAEIQNDLALINNYWVEARLWLTGKPRTAYEPHVSEVIRADMAYQLIRAADIGPKLTTEYIFLLLRSPLHSTSFADTRSYFAYRARFLSQLTGIDLAERQYLDALDVLSRTRCYADGSIFYRSISQAKKVIERIKPLQKLALDKLKDGSLLRASHREIPEGSSSEGSSMEEANVFLTPGITSILEAGLKSYGGYVAEKRLEESIRPLKRSITRFQKRSGFKLSEIRDENHEAWAEFAEDSCRALLRTHTSNGAAHADPRTNAVYGEALIELAVMRYFYDKEDAKATLRSWEPTEMVPRTPLSEKFTDGRKRLWLRMAELDKLKLGP